MATLSRSSPALSLFAIILSLHLWVWPPFYKSHCKSQPCRNSLKRVFIFGAKDHNRVTWIIGSFQDPAGAPWSKFSADCALSRRPPEVPCNCSIPLTLYCSVLWLLHHDTFWLFQFICSYSNLILQSTSCCRCFLQKVVADLSHLLFSIKIKIFNVYLLSCREPSNDCPKKNMGFQKKCGLWNHSVIEFKLAPTS